MKDREFQKACKKMTKEIEAELRDKYDNGGDNFPKDYAYLKELTDIIDERGKKLMTDVQHERIRKANLEIPTWCSHKEHGAWYYFIDGQFAHCKVGKLNDENECLTNPIPNDKCGFPHSCICHTKYDHDRNDKNGSWHKDYEKSRDIHERKQHEKSN